MLEKAVQAAIYEKALKNHYIEILYIDFEDTGKCIKLHQDTNLLNGENIFPESDEQMFDDYICEKIMRYASGNIEDLNRVKQQMTMEAIIQGTAEHIMHHVMINFMLNGEMRFMQFDFTRESADTKNVFLFVEDYTVPQQQAFITTLRSIENSAVLFCILSEEEDAKTTLCYPHSYECDHWFHSPCSSTYGPAGSGKGLSDKNRDVKSASFESDQ